MLEGDLTDFTLPDVLRLLAFTAKTGRLTVDGGQQHGRLELVDGRVRDASADATRLPLARRILGTGLLGGPQLLEVLADREELPTDLELARALVAAGAAEPGTLVELLREQTVDAAFDLLRWSTGSFRFVGLPGVDEDENGLELTVRVEDLLDEVTARLESWDELAERTGARDAVVTIARPERSEDDRVEVALPPDGWGLLALVDGQRTVADLVAVSGQGEYRTRSTLGALLDEGVVTVGETEQAGPLERLLADQAALAERERSLGDGRPARPRRSRIAAPPRTEAVALPPPAADPDPSAAATPAPAAAPTAPAPAEPRPPLTAVAEVPAARRVPAATPAGAPVRKLRTTVRGDRLRTDPTIDEDLVSRLIAGVEAL